MSSGVGRGDRPRARRQAARLCSALVLAVQVLTGAIGAAMPSPDDSQADSIARARALLSSGNALAAESLLRSIVEADPRNGAARVLLGRLALEQGELESAREHLEIATAAEPPRPYLAWHLLGRVQLLLGRPEPAAASWRRALELAPRFAPALLGHARAAIRLEAPERAITDLERIRSLQGSPPEATFLLAELRLLQGRFEEAGALLQELAGTAGDSGPAARMLLRAAGGRPEDLGTLRRALSENLQLARGFLAFGLARLRSGDPLAASHSFRAALEIDDQDPVPWLFLRRSAGGVPLASYPAPFPDLSSRLETARGMQDRGEWSEARALVESVLERRPHHVPARLLALRDAESRDDRWAALAGYRRLLEWLPHLPALELKAAAVARSMEALELAGCLAARALGALPGDGSIHFLLGVIQTDAGHHDAAADSCRRAIALGLEEAPVYLALGLAEFERMRIPEAIAAYARALELDPEASRAIPRFALASLTDEELEALGGLLEAGVAATAENENALYGLGAMSLRANDLDRARTYFERLHALTPDDPQVQYNLGLIYLRQGERARGEAAMERFRELKAAEDEQWLAHNRAHALRLEARDAAAGGDPKEAIRIYGELAAADTADLQDYLAAGRTCLEIGDYRRGYGWFDRVLANDPYRPEALQGLADAADGLGRIEVARRARERLALLSWPCSAAGP